MEMIQIIVFPGLKTLLQELPGPQQSTHFHPMVLATTLHFSQSKDCYFYTLGVVALIPSSNFGSFESFPIAKLRRKLEENCVSKRILCEAVQHKRSLYNWHSTFARVIGEGRRHIFNASLGRKLLM